MASARELLDDGGPVSSGLAALDYILHGGYAANRVHLIEGRARSGQDDAWASIPSGGRKQGERCLYITLSESREELVHVARTHGWDLGGIEIFELIPPELSLDSEREQSIVYAPTGAGETVQMVMDDVERAAPARIVFDSLSEIRLLAQGRCASGGRCSRSNIISPSTIAPSCSSTI
jgi:circadian clock protein KaiC